jgi:DNA gyrase subunit A
MAENQPNLDFINIEDEMRLAYIDYSMSVIVGRALPDARDGLKPSNRRILYAMCVGGWVHNRPYVKCARVVGDVIGKYHPHGDQAVYDTLVRMAQDFSLREMLIDGQGNFGSIDGDPPAAYRYTESRLRPIAEEMLADIDKRTVDMQPNFDERETEPTVLPARVPNLLVNGSTGIAVGMATNMPPHNLREIIDGIVHLIEHPDAQIVDLMQFVKGPDFPTGATIQGVQAIRNMYETGRGLIRMRGEAEIDEARDGRPIIIVRSIPYAVNKATLIEKIAQLANERKIEGISDIRDESSKEGIRIVIELKRNSMPNVVLNNIQKHSQLSTTFGAIMLALDKDRPKVMNLKELMICFIDHRFEVITRRTNFDLEKSEARAHVLEGLRIAMAHLDDVVKVIRDAKNRDEARAQLIERFTLSVIQANAILEMRLYQLTGLEQDKIENEYKEVLDRIAYLKDLLSDDQKLYGVMKDDLLEIREKYGGERRTEIFPDEGELNIEDLLADTPWVITLSRSGYIKRVALETYHEQRRGGKGVQGMNTKDEDYVEKVFTASTHDVMLFFTSKGRVYWKKAYEIPESSRAARGKALINFLEVGPEESIADLLCIREFSEDRYLVMATKDGVVKKTRLSAFRNIRAGGIIAVAVDEDDLLIGIRLTSGEDELVLSTRRGMSIRFEETQLRDQGRATRGVRGISLAKTTDDRVVNITVVNHEGSFLTVTENGYGKRTRFDEYRFQKRGGKGVIAIRTSVRNGMVVGAYAVQDTDAIMLITEGGQTVRMPVGDLRIISRNTQGVRLISLAKGDRLVSATIIVAEEEIEIPQDENEGESVAQDSVESPEEDAGESPAQDPEEPASE